MAPAACLTLRPPSGTNTLSGGDLLSRGYCGSELDARELSHMLRTVIKEDEWLLYLHGAVLGFEAGSYIS